MAKRRLEIVYLYNNMYEWQPHEMKAWARYQNAVKTQTYADTISLQAKQIKDLQKVIDEFSDLMISEIKEHIQRLFADKLNTHIYRKIVRAVHNAVGEKQEVLKLQFATDSLRFLSPNEIHALVLDRFMMHIKKEARFGVNLTTRFKDKEYAKSIIYEIVIPQMMYRYAKLA